MPETPVQRALAASTVALLVAVGCLALLLPPLNEQTIESPVKVVLISLALATALLLHWIFLAIGVRRMGRSVLGWVALSLLFPAGGAAALILLSWFNDESPRAQGA